MGRLLIPHNYTPRDYQLPLLAALDSGIKRAVAIWHRRAGKDKTLINLVVKQSLQRVGTYFYLFPTYAQGKKILWDGMDKDGFKFLSHIPPEIIANSNSTEMKVTLVNGSVIQVVGTDKIDSIVGTNPIGCVFSEYALQNPTAWEMLRPILRENGGWAVFNYTPRGKNHGFDLYRMALTNPAWFISLLTVRDTGALSEVDIQAERDAGMDEDLIQQEFYCSFDAAVQGAYYAKQMQAAETEKRISNVPYEPAVLVNTWWDLGIGDATAIWFTQSVGRELRIIDYYEASGEGLPHYAKVLQDKPYVYDRHNAPHDIEVRELGSGKSRLETATALGLRFVVVPKLSIEDGIEAARNLLPRCWFDQVKCKRGIDALVSYHKEFDDKRKQFKSYPYHDWSSHAADAFRYLAVGYREKVKSTKLVYPNMGVV